MENASKALLIAAAVLIVIIIIAVGMKIYSSTTGTQKVGLDTGKTLSDKTGEATDIATYEITGKRPANPNIKYYEGETNNPKSQEDAGLGDTIKIGDEQFMIFSRTDTKIKAMPYYNLVTVTADGTVKQGLAVEGTSTAISSTFSTDVYWTLGEDAINMNDSRNNIQQYIKAYKTTLGGLGANGIQVRAAKYSELYIEEVTDTMRNPGQTDKFWLGSSNIGVWCLFRDGSASEERYYNFNKYGVRPIIIILI